MWAWLMIFIIRLWKKESVRSWYCGTIPTRRRFERGENHGREENFKNWSAQRDLYADWNDYWRLFLCGQCYQAEAMGPSGMAGLYYRCAADDTGLHPERPDRLRAPVESSSYMMIQKTAENSDLYVWMALYYLDHHLASLLCPHHCEICPALSAWRQCVCNCSDCPPDFWLHSFFGFSAAAKFQNVIVVVLMAAMLVFILMEFPM